MSDIQTTIGGALSYGLLDRETNLTGLDSQCSAGSWSQIQSNEKQLLSGETTEDRLKAYQSPLDYFLSDSGQLKSNEDGNNSETSNFSSVTHREDQNNMSAKDYNHSYTLMYISGSLKYFDNTDHSI